MNKIKRFNAPKIQMGGYFRKIVSLLVALSMALVFVPCAFADEETEDVTTPVYKIENVSTGLALVSNGDRTTNGTAVVGWSYSASASSLTGREWYIEYDSTNSYYAIENRKSVDESGAGVYMEIYYASTATGGLVDLYADTGSLCQSWYILPVGTDDSGNTLYRIVNVNSGYSIVDNGSGVQATQEAYTGDDSQLWTITAVEGTSILPSYTTPESELGKTTNIEDSVKLIDMSATGDSVTTEGRINLISDNISGGSDTAMADRLSGWTWLGVTDTSASTTFGWSGVNMNTYNSDSVYSDVFQFWCQYANTTDPMYAEGSTDMYGYYVYEFYPHYNNLTSGDMAFYDNSGTLITAYTYNNSYQLTPQATDDTGSFASYAPSAVTYETEGTTALEVEPLEYKVRLYVINNTTDGNHTVEWWHNDGGTWTLFATQTYDGCIYGFGKIDVYRTELSSQYGAMGLGDFKVYGGDFTNTEDALTVDLGEVDYCAEATLPETVMLDSDGNIVTEDGTLYYVRWDTEPDTTIIGGTATATGVLVDTGRAVTGTVTVNAESATVVLNYVDSEDTDTIIETENYSGYYGGNTFTAPVSQTALTIALNEGTESAALYKVTDSDELTQTLSAGENTIAVKVEKLYDISGSSEDYTDRINLAEDADFENGNYLDNSTGNFAIVEASNGVGSYALQHTLQSNYAARYHDGIGGGRSFKYRVGVETGKTYYYSIDVYNPSSSEGIWSSFMLTGDTQLYHSADTLALADETEVYFGGIYGETQTNVLADKTSDAEGSRVIEAGVGWQTISGVVSVSTDGPTYFEFDAYYLCDAKGSMYDNIMFYEIDTTRATINHNYDGTTIKTTTYNWAVGEVMQDINEAAEAAIVYDGDVYCVNEVKESEYTVQGSDVIEFEYEKVTLNISEKTSETHLGAQPLDLPESETISVTTTNGNTAEFDVTYVWNDISFEGVSTGDTVDATGDIYINGDKVTSETVSAKVSIVDVENFVTHYYSFDTDFSDSVGGSDPTDTTTAIIENGTLRLNESHLVLPAGLMTDYEEFTISAYYSVSTFECYQRIFDFGLGSSGGDLYYAASGGTSSRPQISVGSVYTSSWNDTAGKWYHIVITGDSDGTVILYRDNDTQWATLTSSYAYSEIFTDDANYYIGDSNWSSDPDFDGYIDDFKIYNVALTQSEVAVLMAEDAPYDDFEVTLDTSLAAVSNEYSGSTATANDLGIGLSFTAGGYDNYTVASYGVDYSYTNSEDTEVTGEISYTDSDLESMFISNNSNLRLTLSPWIMIDSVKIYGAITSTTSLYEEVIADLAANVANGTYTSENVDSDRLANYNKVIAKGGVVYDSGLDDIRAQIMDYDSSAENQITITINSTYSALGIGFLCSDNTIYVGSSARTPDSSTTVYDKITINTSTDTVTLSNSDAETAEAVTFSLEEVEIEFVYEDILEEDVLNDVDVELDFTEIM